MKKYLFKTIQTLLVFSLAFTLTNCGNIDNPLEEISGSGSVPASVVEEAKVLGAALEEGATVTVKYTVAGTDYTATFKKNGDNYELVSNTAGARALTRGSAPTYTPSLSVSADGAKLLLSVIQDGTTDVVLEAYMDIKTGETCVFQTKEGGFDVSAFKIGDEQPAVTNPYNKQVTILGRGANSRAFTRNAAYETYAYINYKDGETWKDVYDRYKAFNHEEFTITEDSYLSMTQSTLTFYLVYSLSTPLTYAKSTELVGKNGEAACETYYTTQTDPNSPLANVTSEDIGKLIGADGKIYSTAAAATEASTTAVAMIAYVGSGSDCEHGLAIQLNSSPEKKKWANAKTYAEGLTAVPGGTWRLPSKDDWQNMFLGCAKSGDASASDDMDPIAGFKEKIAAAGVTWLSSYYWSSTESEPGGLAWDVKVDLDGNDANAYFSELATADEDYVLGCLAF